MSATARTSIYVGYDPVEVETARQFIIMAMRQAEIQGYTIYAASGFWNGIEESALVVEVIGDNSELDFALGEVAHRLRFNELLEQESVYVVREMVDLVVM